MLVGIAFLLYLLPCPTAPQYIFFRVTLALAAASFSAILLGFIELRTKFLNMVLRAGGGFAVFFLILRYVPEIKDTSDKCAPLRDYTFILHNTDNSSVSGLDGKVSLLIGNNVREEQIDPNGIATFRDISAVFFDDTVTVEIKIKGWWLSDSHKRTRNTVLKDNRMILPVSEDDSRCCIIGRVVQCDDISRPIPGVSVYISDSTLTDKDGKFKITIPVGKRKNSQVTTFSAPGYQSNVKEILVDTTESTTICLEKKNK
jgi:hypothetical protein